MRLFELLEDFADLGKLSDEDLKKGQALDYTDKDNFRQVNGRTFKTIVTKFSDYDKLRDVPKGLEDLSIYELGEYDKMECFIGKNNSSGYCLKDDGELVSVFSIARSSGLMPSAGEQGAWIVLHKEIQTVPLPAIFSSYIRGAASRLTPT